MKQQPPNQPQTQQRQGQQQSGQQSKGQQTGQREQGQQSDQCPSGQQGQHLKGQKLGQPGQRSEVEDLAGRGQQSGQQQSGQQFSKQSGQQFSSEQPSGQQHQKFGQRSDQGPQDQQRSGQSQQVKSGGKKDNTYTPENFLYALHQVARECKDKSESGSTEKGKGPFNIKYEYWKESSIPGDFSTQANSMEKSKECIQAWMSRHGGSEWSDSMSLNDCEKCARRLFGGPKGDTMQNTDEQWKKFRDHLDPAKTCQDNC